MSAIGLVQVLKQEIMAIAEESEEARTFQRRYRDWMFQYGADEGRYTLERQHILSPERLLTQLAPQPEDVAKRVLDKLAVELQAELQKAAKGPSKATPKQLLEKLEEEIKGMKSSFPPEEQRQLDGHIAEPKDLLKWLAPQPGDFAKSILKRLDNLQQEIKEAMVFPPEKFERFIADLVAALNKQLGNTEPLFSEKEQKRFHEKDKESRKIHKRLRKYFTKSPSNNKHAVWNRILLQEAFPKEIAKIWETPSGKNAWSHAHPGERQVNANSYQLWMFEYGTDEGRYALERGHIVDAKALLTRLGLANKKPPSVGHIFNQLDRKLGAKIIKFAKRLNRRQGATGVEKAHLDAKLERLIAQLLPELNKQVVQTKFPIPEDGLDIDVTLKALFECSVSNVKHAVWNRVLLQKAFPKAIAEVWDTLSGKSAYTHADPELNSRYQRWMFEPAKDTGRYELKRDHIVDPEGIIQRLASADPDSFAKRIFGLFDPHLQENITKVANDLAAQQASNGKKLLWRLWNRRRRFWPGRRSYTQSGPEAEVEALIAELLPKLNVQLARPEELFSADEQERFPNKDEESQKTCARLKLFSDGSKSQIRHALWNRVLLQEAFPTEIAKIWDTLSGMYAWTHAHPLNAVCLSGGGIRSATFGLGVVQSLAQNELLDKFDYISTVSGGGYVGGWLSAWFQRCGFSKVVSDLKTDHTRDPRNTEPEPLTHLRRYSNYLTPKLGLTSADTWTLIATYLRNLALNWVVFIPMLAALLAVPRLCVAVFRLRVSPQAEYSMLALGGLLGILAIVYAALNRPSLRDPQKASRGNRAFLVWCLALLYFSSVCFTAVWAWVRNDNNQFTWLSAMLQTGGDPPPPEPFLFLGVAVHILACLVYAWRLRPIRTAEVIACLFSGLLAGFLLWRGAVGWSTNLHSNPNLELFVSLGMPYFLLSLLLSVFFFVGVVSYWTKDEDREWWARMGAWILLAGATWVLFSTLVLFAPQWLMKLPRLLAALGGVTGVVTLVLSKSGLTGANKKDGGDAATKILRPNLILGFAAPIFLASFVAALSLGTTWLLTAVPIGGEHFECDGGTVLSEDEIIDLPFLAARLKEHRDADPLSGFLWNRFDCPLRTLISGYDNTEAQTRALRGDMVSEINDIIVTNDLTATNAFPPDKLLEQTRTHLATYAKGASPGTQKEHRMQHNRFLLEKAYPRELAPARFDHRMITHQTPIRKIAAVALILAAASLIVSWVIDTNRFSLHAVYRNRLIRAYLGASNPDRHPNAFTGFDPKDNLHMATLNHRPFHTVNMALNLVTGKNLAWQERKAESFTASPLHAGSWRLGFRRTQDYASRRSRVAPEPAPPNEKENGLTLGTAVTISGAAASPNMGYHSSPVLSALMTLFNIRLGAWLGNPGNAGNDSYGSYKDRAPRSALWHLVREMLGLTDDNDRYVYLSDGGHFENLGLYEMVLRRCHYIFVSDASCDPDCKLEDLGNAIRKIRIDLGIPIVLADFKIEPRKRSQKSKYCAIGEIKYSEVDGKGIDDGVLIYIKPAIGGNEPKDVFNYKESSETFPHESTVDQWFSESQFESYRALGAYIVQTMCNGGRKKWRPPPKNQTLKDLEERIGKYLGP